MSKMTKNDDFNDDGSKPNDFIDGLAITAVMLIVVAGIVFFLYTM